jgi:hypothetical protein
MSVAVGVETDGGVWLGADSCVSFDDVRDVGSGKLVNKGSWAMGVVGWGRADQVLQYELNLPGPVGEEPPMLWAVTSLVPALKKLADKHGPWGPVMDSDTEDQRMQKSAFMALVAVSGHLLYVDESFCVHRSHRGYFAIGAGDKVALGALYATHPLDARNRCMVAVRAASAWIDGVSEPVELQWVPA